ncbi:MAG: DUF3829 domain-containing protein [Deltaproteobacteria bacterium]|nr:DUF3829 domain-containing protein [Deltaproteobacteria bacterium]
MRNKTLLLSLLLVSLLPACGFDKLLKKLEEQKKNAQTLTQNNNLNSLTQKLTNEVQNTLEKPKVQENPRETINQIINCYNNTQPAIAVTEHDYFSTLQTSQSICKYSRRIPSPIELTAQLSSISSHLGQGFGGYNGKKALEICKQSLTLAEKNPGSYATATSFLKPYVETLEAVVADLELVKNYYSQQNYKDDACAQGKKLFDAITGKLDVMRGKEIAIALEMDKIKRSLDLTELAEMEKSEGRKFEWYYLSFTIQAENLLKTLHLEQNGRYNAAEYQRDFPDFEKTFQGLTLYVNSHADEEKVKSMWSRLDRSSNGLYAQAKILNREMSTQQKVNDTLLDNFIHAYNSYIGDVNSQVFDRY